MSEGELAAMFQNLETLTGFLRKAVDELHELVAKMQSFEERMERAIVEHEMAALAERLEQARRRHSSLPARGHR